MWRSPLRSIWNPFISTCLHINFKSGHLWSRSDERLFSLYTLLIVQKLLDLRNSAILRLFIDTVDVLLNLLLSLVAILLRVRGVKRFLTFRFLRQLFVFLFERPNSLPFSLTRLEAAVLWEYALFLWIQDALILEVGSDHCIWNRDYTAEQDCRRNWHENFLGLNPLLVFRVHLLVQTRVKPF